MPSGGGKGSGNDSLGSVLVTMLIVVGVFVGGMLLLGYCTEHDAQRTTPAGSGTR